MSVVNMWAHRKVSQLSMYLIGRQATACWVSECWEQMASNPAHDARTRLYAKARAVVVHDRVLREIDGQPSRIPK